MRSTETWISHQKVLTLFSVGLHTLHIGTCLGVRRQKNNAGKDYTEYYSR